MISSLYFANCFWNRNRLLLVPGLDELVDQSAAAVIKPTGEAFLTSRQTEAEGDMGFAGAAIAKCDDVFTTLDVFTTRQFQNHHLVERWHGFEVEAVQAFDGGGSLRHP